MVQYTSRSQLKDHARDKMAGQYGNAILMSICEGLITFSLTFAVSMIFTMISTIQILMGGSGESSLAEFLLLTLCTTICSVFTGIFRTGTTLFYLNLSCGRPATISNLFYGYKYMFKKSLTISAVVILLNAVCSLPYEICYFLMGKSTDKVPLALLCIAFIIIGMCVYLPIAFGLSQSFYLLLDFPQYSASEIMKLSFRIMKGHKWELFCLRLSFIPMYLLGLLSFGIGNLWVKAYQSMTCSLYFLDLMQGEH